MMANYEGWAVEQLAAEATRLRHVIYHADTDEVRAENQAELDLLEAHVQTLPPREIRGAGKV